MWAEEDRLNDEEQTHNSNYASVAAAACWPPTPLALGTATIDPSLISCSMIYLTVPAATAAEVRTLMPQGRD